MIPEQARRISGCKWHRRGVKLRAGCRYYDGDSAYTWAVLPAAEPLPDGCTLETADASVRRRTVQALAARVQRRYGVRFRPVHYHGPGQSFAEPVNLHRAGSRLLLTQRHGRDV